MIYIYVYKSWTVRYSDSSYSLQFDCYLRLNPSRNGISRPKTESIQLNTLTSIISTRPSYTRLCKGGLYTLLQLRILTQYVDIDMKSIR